MPPCEPAGICIDFLGCNVICNNTIQRQPCIYSSTPLPTGIAGIFYACDFPIFGWGQSAGTCDYFENSPLNPDDDMTGSIGVFGGNDSFSYPDPIIPFLTIWVYPRSEVPFLVANIQPNTNYLLSYVRRSVNNINITTGAAPLPLIAEYDLEPTHLEIATYNWENLPCVSSSQVLSQLPLTGSVSLLSDNHFGGANPEFAWKQIIAAVTTGNTPTHNALYCYIRRDISPEGGYYIQIDHFEMIPDIFISNQTVNMTCNETSVTIGDPSLCANTDLLNMRYRWSESTDGGNTWTALFSFDNQTSIAVAPDVPTQYKLTRYFPDFFIAPDGTQVPISTINGITGTVVKNAIITVIPYYQGFGGSLDYTATNSAPTLWTNGSNQLNNSNTATTPLLFGGTLTIPTGVNIVISGMNIEFGPSARIVVQPGATLSLQNCHLTGTCNQMWQGIQAYGNSSGNFGRITTPNDGSTNIIEHAVTGICTFQYPILNFTTINNSLASIPDFNALTGIVNLVFTNLWTPGVINTANAQLQLHNVRFVDCFMGINNSWTPSNNDVYENCLFTTTGTGLRFPFTGFSRGEAGIFAVFNQTMLIEGCSFQNMKFGTRTNGTQNLTMIPETVTTTPCIFNNCLVGISSRNFTNTAFPNCTITDNTFINCGTAIQTQGSNATIRRNNISNGQGTVSMGVFSLGSTFTIANNNISNTTIGVAVTDDDLAGGRVFGNNIQNTNGAIMSVGSNLITQIQCNNLVNYNYYAIASVPWAVAAQIGDLADQGNCVPTPFVQPAANVFTPPATGAILDDVYLFPINTSQFFYRDFDDQLPWTDPNFSMSPGVYQSCGAVSPFLNSTYCGSISPMIPSGDVKNLTDIHLRDLMTCAWAKEYGMAKDTANLLAFLQELNTPVAQRYLLQYELQQKNLPIVNQLLQLLPLDREEDISYHYFYDLLYRLEQEQRTFFEITPEEESALLQIADSRSQTAFKAQTMLYLARGLEFEVTLPELNWQTAFKNGKPDNNRTVLLQPNPAQNQVTVTYNLDNQAQSPQAQVQLYFYNVSGKLVYQTTLQGAGTESISVNAFQAGIYFCQIIAGSGKILSHQKLVIVK